METSAHELGQTRLCKLPECDNILEPDIPTRGIWANVCRYCRQGETVPGQNYRLEKGLPAKPGDMWPAVPPDRNAQKASASLESSVKALLAPAKTLERKVATKKQATRELTGAVTEFSTALRAVRDAAQSLIGEEV